MRQFNNILIAGLLAVALALVAAASAQEAEAPASLVYDLYQGQAVVGEVGVGLERGAAGTESSSYAQVGGVIDLSDTLTTNLDGSAKHYRLSGTVQGIEITMDVSFASDGVHLDLDQGGQKQNLTLPVTGPAYVFDNNFLDGYQIAVDQVVAQQQEISFVAVVPQVAAQGTVTLTPAGTASVEYLGQHVTAQRIDGKFQVAGQTLTMTIYLGDDDNILVLEQSPGSVRFVRRSAGASGGATSSAAPGEGDSAAAANAAAIATESSGPTAASRLAEDAHCLEQRVLHVESTGAELYGELSVPVGVDGRAPALLLLPGSGAVDVDGNAAPVLNNSGYRQLAYALACHGFAVLRVAKLGIPPSTGDANAVTVQTYAQNTADWLELLARQPDVDPNRIGLLGHSEGGLIALYAVAEQLVTPQVVALIATPGRRLDVILREQLLARNEEGGATPEQLDALGQQIDAAVAAILSSEGATLELSGDLANNPIAQAFAHAAGLLRSEFEQDPVVLAAQVGQPMVVLQGDKDIQVNPADGELLAAAAPRATLLAFADLTHNLVDTGGPALNAMLPSPTAVISDTLVRALATYLNGHLRAAR